MLSMSKIKSADASAAHYYAEEIRIEDYYLKGQDSPGQWHGAADLGLSGHVTLEQLQNLMAGKHPETGVSLVGRGGSGQRDRNPGWDMTFSAPKSVSILYAMSDEGMREKIRQAHHNAVGKAMAQAEADCLENAARTVSKKGGRRVDGTMAVEGLVWGEFFHRTSRELDPQMHSHCVVPNIARRVDGKWCAPNLKQVFREKIGLGAIYRAELGQGIRTLGFEIEEDRQFFRIKGVPTDLERELSKRRQQIEKRMLSEGLTGGKDASRVALTTRKAKKLIDEKALFSAWQSIGHEYGLTPDTVKEISSQSKEPGLAIDQQARQEIVRKTLAELSQGTSTFTEEQAKAKFAEKAQLVMTAEQIRDSYKDLFDSPDLLRLARDREGQMRYTTRNLRQTEEMALGIADRLTKTQDAGLSKEMIETRLKEFEADKSRVAGKTISLSSDQRDAAAHALGAGRIKVVAGMAGAGKTFSMEAVARAMEKEGYRVNGMAPTGRAAAKLSEAGIETQTVDRYLMMRSKGGQALTDRDVVIIDEAGMIGSRKMERLLSEIDRSGAKAILLGEAEQLQPVEAGGIFRAVSDKIGKAGLTTIVRQESQWQRQAVRHFRAGEAKEGLKLYQEAGKLSVLENSQALIETMVKEHVRLSTEKTDKPVHVVALSKTNAVVDQLNQGIRQELKEQGQLPKAGIQVEVKYAHYGERQKIELAEGDKVVFLKNDRKLGVQNGLFAEVQGFERDGKGNLTAVRFRDETGKDHAIDVSKYPNIRHAYAITGYKSQGSTFSHVLVHATPELSREETYVKMSRQKVDAKLFVSKEAFDVKYSEISSIYRDNGKAAAEEKVSEKQFLRQQEPEQEKTMPAKDKAEKTLEDKLATSMSRSAAKDVSTDYKVTQGQLCRTERLEYLSQELPKLKGEKRLEALAEIASSLGGVTTKYESPALTPPWQAKAREIIQSQDYKKIPELQKEIMSHPKGRVSLQTDKERQQVEALKAELKPSLDQAIKVERGLSRSQSLGKGIV